MADIHLEQAGDGWFDVVLTVTSQPGQGWLDGQITRTEPEREAGG
jgi:hypothetical protein